MNYKKSKLIVEILEDGLNYKLVEDYVVTIDGVTHTVPKGFISDGPSIPGFIESFISKNGPIFFSSIVHDYYYRMIDHDLSKKDVDKLFYKLMVADGVLESKAKLVYQGVRFGGYSSWEQYRPELIGKRLKEYENEPIERGGLDNRS